MKDQFGRNLTDNAELALFRIADALDEILRLVKKDMEEANAELPLGEGAWFGPQDNSTLAAFTYKWEKGNFFD